MSRGWDMGFIRKRLAPVREFERKHGAKIYVGEFSAVSVAEGADKYIAECIALFEEYGWDWTYHAFREARCWSLEYEGTSWDDIHPSADNTRKRVVLDGLRAEGKGRR